MSTHSIQVKEWLEINLDETSVYWILGINNPVYGVLVGNKKELLEWAIYHCYSQGDESLNGRTICAVKISEEPVMDLTLPVLPKVQEPIPNIKPVPWWKLW